jgi:hypothetical protein
MMSSHQLDEGATMPTVTNIDDRRSPQPDGCTLGGDGFKAQLSRWLELRARAQIDRIETADGIRLIFASAPGVEAELRELVAVELECCSWADWNVERRADSLVLDVRSTPDGASTLHALFKD